MRLRYAILAAALLPMACQQKPADYEKVIHDPTLYSQVTGKIVDVITYDIFTPPVASRVQAYSHLAAYEVMCQNDSNYASLEGQLKDLTPGSIPHPASGEKIDYPFASMKAYVKVADALTFSKDMTDAIDHYLDSLAQAHGMPEDLMKNSTAFGEKVGQAIINWSKKDNYAETRSAPKYTVTGTDSTWVPTPPAYFQAVEPEWKTIRTLALGNPATFGPPLPIIHYDRTPGSTFDKLVHQVYDSINVLTDSQKAIANFWDCNGFKMNLVGHVMYATKAMTPGDHWMGITGIIAKNKKADFDKTVYTYTATSFGIMDAFIFCWYAKYTYNLVRPETVINKYMDPNWKPYLQTPPFPEYYSAHSTISAAAAQILEDIYGKDLPFRDSTERAWGWPDRQFSHPLQAAREAAISRFYGGIHYRPSCITGSDLGILVGQNIMDKLKMRKPD